MTDWYERLDEQARAALRLADAEARRLNYEYVGCEHLLLGVVTAGFGIAVDLLPKLDVDELMVRHAVDQLVSVGPNMWPTGRRLPQTPRAKRAIELAVEEARDLCHNHVGAEHLMLGLLREGENTALQVLMNLGLNLDHLRAEILSGLGRSTIARATAEEFASTESHDLSPEDHSALDGFEGSFGRINQELREALLAQDFERWAQLRVQWEQLRQQRRTVLSRSCIRGVINPAWLSWNGGAVARIARTIRDENRWHELPVLADALAEAGCTNQEMIDHCRQPGEHFDRCWVITLLLESEQTVSPGEAHHG